ncbi:NAD-dependent epimerase/dehydratase family protein [Nocardiopsis alborubida]|uniref:NAD(P)-dependent oxidoreductase n=1 Tax=Nocardiopsis alborubida TaxID=146802 RepID=A0A7X6RP43_9ACTN|nr:NAD(P)-dependent oxidoreductase [Nocardiopsis alborubida]NKY97193.1 NAD(P)-dependent oxidoreductase [Nocardiopsis alborubida]
MTVLIVGASGQVGTGVASRLCAEGLDVVGLTRNPAPHVERYAKLRLGDARRPDLGLGPDEAAELAASVTTVVVATGRFDLSLSLAEARSEHIAPLRGALRFAQDCPSLRNVVLVSSLLGVGATKQRLRSSTVPDPARHRNFYEWAKLSGELVARASGLPVDVVRAGHVLPGDEEYPGLRDAPPAALFELLRPLAAGWPLPVVGSNRYWATPSDFMARIVTDRVLHGTGSSSVWAVDPASPTYAEIFDLVNARFGVRAKRVRSEPLATALAAVLRPEWIDLPMSREIFDYCVTGWDLDLSCLRELVEAGRVTPPEDRGYLVRALDHAFDRLRERLP